MIYWELLTAIGFAVALPNKLFLRIILPNIILPNIHSLWLNETNVSWEFYL